MKELKVEMKWKMASLFFFFLTLFDHIPGLIAHLLNNIQRKKIHIFVCCILILSNHVFFL